MAPRQSLSLPTTAPLSSSHKISSTDTSVIKTLSRLTRPSLLHLAQEWLKPSNQSLCPPVLGEHEDDPDAFYEPAYSLEEVQEVYAEFAARKGGKREVLDRMLEGDWRHGLSLRQLAMADMQYLLDHPTSQRWVALKLSQALSEEAIQSRSMGKSKQSSSATKSQDLRARLPQFHARTFVKNMQSEVGSLIRAHWHLVRHPSLPLTILRIAMDDSPYNSQTALSRRKLENWRTILIAVPDDSPFIYLSLPTQSKAVGLDNKSLRTLIIDAIPKALSRPGQRYTLNTTSLSSKSLPSLLACRGPGRTNAAGGGWSIFADGSAESAPLHTSSLLQDPSHRQHEQQQEINKENAPPPSQPSNPNPLKRPADSPPSSSSLSLAESAAKKRRLALASARFGPSSLPHDGKGLDRLSMRIEEPFPLPPSSSTTTTHPLGPAPTPTSTNPPIQKAKRGRRSTLETLETGDPDSSIVSLPDDSNGAKKGGWTPSIQLVFHGNHVFAGIRQLVEHGAIDGKVMPGWMSGDEGVSVGCVRGGRVVGGKGAGAGG
ncbi:hypothetical protein MMC10_001101 [Thelotrema lepadinum]|nr:hypothetical protein [Thelotrema lepadinum]